MKTHISWLPTEKKYWRLLIWFLRDRILLPHTKIHVRRGNIVVVNAYTLLEGLRLYEYGEVCKGHIKPEDTFMFNSKI